MGNSEKIRESQEGLDMSETVAETIQYRHRVEGAIIDDNVVVLPTTVFVVCFDLVSSRLVTLVSLYLKDEGIPITSNLIQDSTKYIDMLTPPEVAESIKARLHIDPEIKERLGGDRYFNYALNNIINIINELLKDPGFRYRIDVRLRDEGNKRGWERVDLVIKFPDEHYEEITRHWKAISAKVSQFYKSLQSNPVFSEDRIIQIRKFIYIVVRSEDW